MKASIEKVFKSEDGGRIKVKANMYIDRGEVVYSYSVETCEKGKRTWSPVTDKNDYTYRLLSMKERSDLCKANYLQVAGKHRINSALQDLWKGIEPTE